MTLRPWARRALRLAYWLAVGLLVLASFVTVQGF
jgi:hypothetical protein